MPEEKSIANVKVKTTDLCIKCNVELKTVKFGGDNLFGFSSSGTGGFYCDNVKCEFFGYVTLGRRPHSEKVVELEEDKKEETK